MSVGKQGAMAGRLKEPGARRSPKRDAPMPQSNAPSSRKIGSPERLGFLIYLAMSAAVVAFFSTGIYSVDAYNHIARLTVECAPASDPLRAMWQIEYGLIPNLAIDLINRPLCGTVSPETLIPLLTGTALALIFAAAWRLQRLIAGRNSYVILLLPAVGFNLVTFMGFTNYLIGIALLTWYAVFLFGKPLAERGRWGWIVVSNLFGAALFFCRVFAALAGLIVLGIRILGRTRLTDARALVRVAMLTAAAYAVPLVLVLLAPKSSPDVLYYTLGKPRTLVAGLYFGSYGAAGLIGALWALIIYAGVREKYLSIPIEGARLALCFLLCILLIPTRIGNGLDIDSRLAVPATIFFLVSIRANARPRAYVALVALLGIGTLTFHLANALPKRALLARQVAELRAAASVVPPYATVLTLSETRNDRPIDYVHFHMGSILTVERAAFNPLEFSGRGMQPMDATPGFQCRNVEVSQPIPLAHAHDLLDDKFSATLNPFLQRTTGFARDWTSKFSHILYIHEGRPNDLAEFGLKVVSRGSYFTILENPRVAVTGPEGPCH